MIGFLGRLTLVLFIVIITSALLYRHWLITQTTSYRPDMTTSDVNKITPFPFGVFPSSHTIVERPELDLFIQDTIASNHTPTKKNQSWLALFFQELESYPLFQQLANPSQRVAVIWSGERKEQVTRTFQSIFDWTDEETVRFASLIYETEPYITDGAFYPGRYIFTTDAKPDTVASHIAEQFYNEVIQRYSDEISSEISLTDILIIASLIEREAYDFNDMRYISGIIWNRLFIDMPLQIDATLQYARGVPGNNRTWWPVPTSHDKFYESPYNTYLNKGLPPNPISNPSIEAIIAALNPRETDCLFYIHNRKGEFFCSSDYDSHRELIKTHL